MRRVLAAVALSFAATAGILPPITSVPRTGGTYLCNHGTGYDGPSGLGARDTLRERRDGCHAAGRASARASVTRGVHPELSVISSSPEATPARHLGGGSAYQVRHSKTR